MPSSMLQQRASTNIPSSAELGAVKQSSDENSQTTRSVTQHPSASQSAARELSALQLRVDELEAEKAYFMTRVQTLERRLHESESRCMALEEERQAYCTKASHSGSPVASTPTASGPAHRETDTLNLQLQINELRHAVRELSQRNSLPRASSMEYSVRSELRSPRAINPEMKKLREVILHQQQIIKALQGELDWTISPSPTNLVAHASKSCTLPEGRDEAGLWRSHSTARTVMAARSTSDPKEPADQTHSHHPGVVDEPEPQPPHPAIRTSATQHEQDPNHADTNASAVTEDAEPFVMSYANLDPLAVLGNTSFDPFAWKIARADAARTSQSEEDAISARSTALCNSRLSEVVQETASRLQVAFKDLDEEEAMTESAVTPPPRRAVLLPQLSAFDESFGDLEEPLSSHASP